MSGKDQEEKETSFRRKVLTTIEILIDIESTSEIQQHLKNLHGIAWDEVIEERFVNKQCGFPACSQSPPKKTKSQLYQIDKKEGKIYEFCKQRSKFCTEKCYQKNLFVRNQLDEQPLWITGNNEQRIEKIYEVPDESFVSPVAEKSEEPETLTEKEPSVEFVADAIIANVPNLKLNEEYSDPKPLQDGDDEPEKEPYRLTEDDKDFIKSIKEFKKLNFGESQTPKISKNPEKPKKVKLSKGDQKKEEEILARLREKYGNKNLKQRKPPILIEAHEIKQKVNIDHKKDTWLINLVKSWFTPETRKLIQEGARPSGGLTEQILMDFLSGKKVDAGNSVTLPNLDKYNVKEKRLCIFLNSIRHHWTDLESRLQLGQTRRDILSRVATTFKLESENITGWNKREINAIVIALFLIVCLVDVELGDDFFKGNNASPELIAASMDLCGIDSQELTGLHSAIKAESTC